MLSIENTTFSELSIFNLLPVKVRLPSAVIAFVPVPVNTELLVKVVAPVPPLPTGKVPVTSVVRSIAFLVICCPLNVK